MSDSNSNIENTGIEVPEGVLPPLLFAAANGNLSVIQDLLHTPNIVDIDEKGPGGWTALTFAAAMGHVKVFKYLLSRGARIIKSDYESLNAIALAMQTIWPKRRPSANDQTLDDVSIS